MKLIIAGSRTVNATVEELDELIKWYGLTPTEIVSGTANGMDQCGEAWARARNVPIKQFPADWDKFGKSAGHKRNAQMAEYGDVLLLVWDGESKGSAGMKSIMEKANKIVLQAIVKKPEPKPTAEELLQDVRSKVEYVRSQGQTRNHHCHWPGCEKQVPPAQWGCKTHWFKLPKYLRDRVWATYKPGQEVNMTPSRAYLLVADQVQKWIQENVK